MTDTPLTELLDPDAGPGSAPVNVDQPDDVDDYDDEFGDAGPRRRVPRFTMLLLAAALVAVGFTGGILMQKHAVAGTTATGVPSFGAGFPSGGFPGAGGGQPPAGAGTTGTSNGSTSSAGSPAVIGTVARVDGTTLTVKDLGGKEHTVTTTSDTTITRSASVPVSQLKPGQSVRVDGSKKADGTVVATSVTAR